MRLHWIGILALCVSCSSVKKERNDEYFSLHLKDQTTKIVRLRHLNEDYKKKYHENKNKSSEQNYSNGITPFISSPGAVDLGMGNVPVLDQGQYGTCVTFSSTAALDALLNEGDIISQQCSLELDAALGNSYWDGADYPSQIIAPLNQYGYVNKPICPDAYANTDASIDLSQYSKISNNLKVTYLLHNPISIPQIKTALKSGHRVAIGTMLQANNFDPISVQGFNVKINGKVMDGGLWACEQPGNSTNYCSDSDAGHEIVVIGYDDNQQLLKIRNSWSSAVGDSGDFYMTYTFFSSQVMDGTEIY